MRPSGSQMKLILTPPEDVLQSLEIFLIITTKGEGGSSGQRPGVLLNILYAQDHPPQQGIIWPRRVHSAKLEKFWIRWYMWNCFVNLKDSNSTNVYYVSGIVLQTRCSYFKPNAQRWGPKIQGASINPKGLNLFFWPSNALPSAFNIAFSAKDVLLA